MTQETISIESQKGKEFTGYLSLPTSGKGPGIVLLQEIFGVNSSLRAAADRLAKEGFTVLAPDLFWRIESGLEFGYEGKDLEKAFECYQKFDSNRGLKDVGQAIENLRNHPACSGKVAVMGYSMGGKLAYLAASSYEVDAAVSICGVSIADYLSLAKNISVPLLMHFGEKDRLISSEHLMQIKKAFAKKDNVEIHVYEGAEHEFYDYTRNAYLPEAAMLAREHTISFLNHAFIRSSALAA